MHICRKVTLVSYPSHYVSSKQTKGLNVRSENTRKYQPQSLSSVKILLDETPKLKQVELDPSFCCMDLSSEPMAGSPCPSINQLFTYLPAYHLSAIKLNQVVVWVCESPSAKFFVLLGSLSFYLKVFADWIEFRVPCFPQSLLILMLIPPKNTFTTTSRHL